MNKLPFLALVFVAGSASSQNFLQMQNFSNSLNNSDGNVQLSQTNQAIQQVFASNVSMNRSNVSRVINVHRSNNVSQRRNNTHAQANVVSNINLSLADNDGNKFNPQANPINQQPLLINDNNIQINKIEMQQMITAVGNQSQSLGIANYNNVGISLSINLPKINFKAIKFSSSSSKNRSSFRLKTFFAKFNRKMKGKFSFTKNLKMKVDNCFKW